MDLKPKYGFLFGLYINFLCVTVCLQEVRENRFIVLVWLKLY